MFRDECVIDVVAGKGGGGLVSFRREKHVPKGGPDGGGGGAGGGVVLVATERLNSLLGVGRRRRYAAPDGRPGGPSERTGASGDDLVVEVPVGTQVYDREHENLLRDLSVDGQHLLIARGGRGGRGNASFKTAVHQAPRKCEPGAPGERRDVLLTLKLVAEVGLVGLPNAGKSTFLASVSRARPRIADYPFTTLAPQVGIAAVGDFDTLVVADLPGLIEGAAEGAGLGHRFLRHVERCRVLLHLVDVSELALEPPAEALRAIEGELVGYSPELARRPRILVATKCEDEAAEARAAELEREAGCPVRRISAVQGRGLSVLLEEARRLVRDGPDDR
ncbi:MAG: GTPase ObgE [Planctomycetota bacterium]|nr:GTPase ObgE [Planctomycetota bacterium]